jgi:hypothetical protein
LNYRDEAFGLAFSCQDIGFFLLPFSPVSPEETIL